MKPVDLIDIRASASVDLGISEQHPVVLLQRTHMLEGPTLYDMHWEFELGVVLSGTMERVTREWVSPVERGMVWMCGAWEPHGYRIVQAPCRVSVFVVDPLFLMRLSVEAAGDTRLYRPFTVPAAHRPQVRGPSRGELLAMHESLGNRSKDRAWVSLALQSWLLALTERWVSPEPASRGEDRFARLLPALRLAFESRHHTGVVEAARACGMSRNTFTHAFVSATGLTFADFALRRRLRGAAQLLLQTDRMIKAIAIDWGFSDSSHLVRTFERHYGMTPGAYRARARGP